MADATACTAPLTEVADEIPAGRAAPHPPRRRPRCLRGPSALHRRPSAQGSGSLNTVARCSMPRPSPSTAGGPAWGSANLDRRSFALNHELNIACDDPDVARRLERIYAEDLQYAHEVTLEEW